MGRYENRQGRDILAAARADLATARGALTSLPGQDFLPLEHRARIRTESYAQGVLMLADARQRIREWSEQAERDATLRLHRDDVADAATEARRARMEALTARLVAEGRASESPRAAAERLIDEAQRHLGLGQNDRAEALALAAREVFPAAAGDADVVIDLVFVDRVNEDPKKKAALRDLTEARVLAAIADRDLTAAHASLLAASAEAAEALGDHAGAMSLRKDAASSSARAKLAAYAIAQETGMQYVEPDGVMPGVPQQQPEPIHGDLPPAQFRRGAA